LKALVILGGSALHAVRERESVRDAIVSVLVGRLAPAENAGPPPELICPISYDILDDPVLLVGDGLTYSRALITKWLETNSRLPWTGAALSSKQRVLAPNILARQLVAAYRGKQPQSPANKRRRLGPADGNSETESGAAVDQHAMALAIYSS